VEVQGTAERAPFTPEQLGRMVGMASRGIDELHRVEVAVLQEVLRRPGPLVASAAGFAVTDGTAAGRLRESAVVAWLRARPETLRARIGDGSGRRDDARSAAWLAETAAERSAAFATVADVVVDVDDRSVDEVADAVVDALGRTTGPFGDPR